MKVILAYAAVAVLLPCAGAARGQDADGHGAAPPAWCVRGEGAATFSRRVAGAPRGDGHGQAITLGATHAFGG